MSWRSGRERHAHCETKDVYIINGCSPIEACLGMISELLICITVPGIAIDNRSHCR